MRHRYVTAQSLIAGDNITNLAAMLSLGDKGMNGHVIPETATLLSWLSPAGGGPAVLAYGPNA
jgi:hypothetical protein